MPIHRFSDPAVKAVFEAYPQMLRTPLRQMRNLILDVAAAMPSIGPVAETLKWGQPAYRPVRPRTGTTIRVGPMARSEWDYGLFVPCQSTLIADFRDLYPKRFRYEGERAIVFSAGEAPVFEPLKHCIALAFTYHSRR